MTTFAAERRKARTTRTTALLGAGAMAVVAIGAVSTVPAAPVRDLVGAVHDQTYFLLASVNLALFALLVGVRSSTDEYRHGTVGWSVLSTHRRGRWIAAKAAVAAMWGAAIVLIALAVGTALAVALAGARGGELSIEAADLGAGAGMAGAGAAWGAIGVGLGLIVRHQVPAVVAVLVWVLVLENLAPPLLGSTARFLPGQAAHALASADVSTALLSPLAAAVVLLAYVVGLGLGAAGMLSRRPVPPT